MTVMGHKALLGPLEAALPPVSLFIGPKSVGKWQMAEHLREHHGILDSDLLRVHLLTADNARMLVQFAGSFPVGKQKLAIVRLEKASRNSLNVLLKTLEEAPDTVRFILIGEHMPLPTVRSRSHLFEFGLLSVEEVAEVLEKRKGFRLDTAVSRAKLSGGQLDRALAVQDMTEAKPLVLHLLEAFRERDEAALEAVALRWRDEHTELLTVWCNEAISTRWSFFAFEEAEIPGKKLPLRILMALRAEIRPRLVVRYSLMSVLRGM